MHIVVSYPKSGRTWVRFMTYTYLIRKFNLQTDDVVAVEKSLERSPQHFVWSHYYGAMLAQKHYYEMAFDYTQATAHPHILISRNFFGTLASAYYHGQFRKAIFDMSPKQFLRSSQYGVIKLVTFYNQIDVLRQQYAQFHAFRYEALRADNEGVFTQILEALGLPIDEAIVKETVEAGLQKNMQATAADPRYLNTWLGEVDPNAPKNRNCTFGNNTKYHNLFDQEDLDYIAKTIDCLLINKDADYLEGCLEPPAVKAAASKAA